MVLALVASEVPEGNFGGYFWAARLGYFWAWLGTARQVLASLGKWAATGNPGTQASRLLLAWLGKSRQV